MKMRAFCIQDPSSQTLGGAGREDFPISVDEPASSGPTNRGWYTVDVSIIQEKGLCVENVKIVDAENDRSKMCLF